MTCSPVNPRSGPSFAVVETDGRPDPLRILTGLGVVGGVGGPPRPPPSSAVFDPIGGVVGLPYRGAEAAAVGHGVAVGPCPLPDHRAVVTTDDRSRVGSTRPPGRLRPVGVAGMNHPDGEIGPECGRVAGGQVDLTSRAAKAEGDGVHLPGGEPLIGEVVGEPRPGPPPTRHRNRPRNGSVVSFWPDDGQQPHGEPPGDREPHRRKHVPEGESPRPRRNRPWPAGIGAGLRRRLCPVAGPARTVGGGDVRVPTRDLPPSVPAPPGRRPRQADRR